MSRKTEAAPNAEDEDVSSIFGVATPSANVAFARRLLEEQVLLFDGMQGAERDAAIFFIASRAVETYETPEGFLYLRPLGLSVLGLLRGNIGRNSLISRFANGDQSREE